MSEQTITDEKVNQALEPLSDVLLVLDKAKNRIEAVKGVDQKGNLQTGEPKQKNLLDFMRIDKNDIFSNFFSNFWRKLNDPSGYQFFKIGDTDMEAVAKKLQAALTNPTPEGNKLLDALEVKHENIIKKEDMENTQKENAQGGNGETEQEYRYDVNKIDWETAHKFGLNRELLEKNGQLDLLLKGYKSDQVFKADANLDGLIFKGDVRLSLREKEDKVVLMTSGIRFDPGLNAKFYGHEFSKEDKENLLKTGNMGRVAELTNYQDGTLVKSLISLDRFTKEPVSYPQEWIKIKDKFGGVKLSKEQKNDLLEGKPVLVEGIKNKSTGEVFNQMLQFSADERKLVFAGDRQILNIGQNQSNEIPTEFRGRQLNEKEQALLKEGKVIRVEDLVNKEGNKLYSGYVFYNEQEKKLEFDFKKPREINQLDQLSNDQNQKQGQTVQNGDTKQDAVKTTVAEQKKISSQRQNKIH